MRKGFLEEAQLPTKEASQTLKMNDNSNRYTENKQPFIESN
jgi:hypothetical protein